MFLCRLHLSLSGYEPVTVTGNRGIFQLGAFALQYLLGAYAKKVDTLRAMSLD